VLKRTRSEVLLRSTIRELADNPTYERYEFFLHLVRTLMLLGIPFSYAIKKIRNFTIISTYADTYAHLIETKYFEDILSL
jgi:hypothetical protein